MRRYPVLNLGQTAPAAQVIPPDQARTWLDKITSSMQEVGVIQKWVQANAAKAASVGLDKDAANLPSFSDISAYPKLSALVDGLKNGTPVDPAMLQCIDPLVQAVQAAKAKMSAFTGGGVGEFIKSPAGIAAGAGVVGIIGGLIAFR